MLAGVMGYAASSVISLLLLFIFLIGMGLGTLELTGSNVITVYYPEKKGRYLNILTAIAGIGAIFSPIVVSFLLREGLSWRNVYHSGMFVLLPVTAYFTFFIKGSSEHERKQTGEDAKKAGMKSDLAPLFRNDFLLMYISNFLYMAAEMGIATWIAEFYINKGGVSPENSTKFLSLFYIGMTVGRMIGSIFADKFGYRNSMLFASAAASASILAGVFGPPALRGCIAVSGIFFSIIFPMETAVISGFPKGDSGRIQGFYFACGGLGGMFGPWIMGIISDYCGINWGIVLGSIFLAGISMLCFRIPD